MDIEKLRFELLQCFEYKDGVLYWKKRTARGPVFVGDVAGSVDKRTGRVWIRWKYKMYPRSVLVWIMLKGCLPVELDHEDQNPGNDLIENLKDGSHQDNMKNAPMRSVNKSGVVGVCWHEKAKKWMAFIKADGKQIYLGVYVNFDEAVIVRKQAEVKYGYSKNHGKKIV